MDNAKKDRRLGKSGIYDWVSILILSVLAFISLFPFYYVIIISFADSRALSQSSFYFLPLSFDFAPYSVLFNDEAIIRGFGVSLFVTFVGTLFNMIVTVSAAYALSKKWLAFRRAILLPIIFSMFFGDQLIPFYITVRNLGLINNIMVMILPAAVNTFFLIILKNYFAALPDSLEESAKIDGANDIIVLIRIILPISLPIIATFILFYAVERWNEWWLAMLFISDPDIKPLQIVLREILNELQSLHGSAGRNIAMLRRPLNMQSAKMAAVVITTIPILLVYPFLQKYFLNGIMIGSIKE